MLDRVSQTITPPDPMVDERLRKLALDNEDLRFECARLKISLEQAQTEILALTDRATVLQHRLDRIHRLAPRGSRYILSSIKAMFGRG